MMRHRTRIVQQDGRTRPMEVCVQDRAVKAEDRLEVTLTVAVPWSEDAAGKPLETLVAEWLAGRATLASKRLSASSLSGLDGLARRASGV